MWDVQLWKLSKYKKTRKQVFFKGKTIVYLPKISNGRLKKTSFSFSEQFLFLKNKQTNWEEIF